MKSILCIVITAVMITTACQQAPKTIPVNIEAEKAAIDSLFNKFYSAFNEKDVVTLASFLNEDLLCLGTDPSEFWNKQQMTDVWTQMLAEFPPEINFISKRDIRVTDDGNSATVVDQYIMPGFSPKILWRNAYNLTKTNGNWMIDLLNCGFLLKNEDISKLIKSLQ